MSEAEQVMSSLPGGFLCVRVLRGIDLVSCDAKGSDPYVVLSLDGQVSCCSDSFLPVLCFLVCRRRHHLYASSSGAVTRPSRN